MRILVIAAFACLTASSAAAQYSFSTFGGHWYTTSTRAADWFTVRAEAMSLGGDLASIQSMPENTFVRSLGDGVTRNSLWLGMIEPFATWSDGSAITFTNWNVGEPNGCCGSPRTMQMYGVGGYGPYATWDDTDPGQGFYGIIELTRDPHPPGVVPEPSSLLLLGSGLFGMGLMARRRRHR